MTLPSRQAEYRLKRSGGEYRLERREVPVPRPAAGEVLLRVHAVSLNRRDILIRSGRYPTALDIDDFVPCSDASGEVVAVGASAGRFAAGDRAMTVYMPGWVDGKRPAGESGTFFGIGGLGVLAEYVVVPEGALAHVPDALSDEAAATLPCAGVTAWNGLVALGRVSPGETVLIQGTGGVSMFALQIAVATGARAVVLSSSDAKRDRCRAMGAAATFNYRTQPEWSEAVRAWTNGAGVDQVVDVGGEATLDRSFAALAPGGHIALVGGLGGFPSQIPAMQLVYRSARVSGVAVGSRAHLEALAAFYAERGLGPIVDHVVPFEDAEAAYARMDAADLFGNVVIRLRDAA